MQLSERLGYRPYIDRIIKKYQGLTKGIRTGVDHLKKRDPGKEIPLEVSGHIELLYQFQSRGMESIFSIYDEEADSLLEKQQLKQKVVRLIDRFINPEDSNEQKAVFTRWGCANTVENIRANLTSRRIQKTPPLYKLLLSMCPELLEYGIEKTQELEGGEVDTYWKNLLLYRAGQNVINEVKEQQLKEQLDIYVKKPPVLPREVQFAR